MTGITQAKQLSSRILAHSSRCFSNTDLRAKNDIKTSVRVLCISTKRCDAPARSDTRVSLSRHNSSTVIFSCSRYAFFRNLVLRACSRFRSRFALAFSAGVMLAMSSSKSSIDSKLDFFPFLLDSLLALVSPSVSLQVTT